MLANVTQFANVNEVQLGLMLDLVTLNMIRRFLITFHDNISILLHQNLKKLSKLNCVAIEMEKEDTQGQTKRPHIPNSKYSEQQGPTGKASKKKVTDCTNWCFT